MTELEKLSAQLISIHALREESDGRCRARGSRPQNFNPRPPRGERPIGVHHGGLLDLISIHALREESDSASGPWLRTL